MQDELHNKLAHLKEYIKELDSVAIAFPVELILHFY